VRSDLGNTKVRIVLRTGQPGQAPEQEVILRYDINDYKAKTELTQQKLTTTVITALRGYNDLTMIETGRQGLRKIIDASASLMQRRSMTMFASGVLTQLGGLLGTPGGGILCTRGGEGGEAGLAVVAASGRFEPLLAGGSDAAVMERIRRTMENRRTQIIDGHTVMYLQTPNRRDVVIYVEADRPLDELELSLLEVFGANISVGFDNLEMFERVVRDNEALERRVEERTRDLNERETRLRTILEDSPVAVTILRLDDGVPVFANSRFVQMMGLAEDDPAGQLTLGGLFAEPADLLRLTRMLDETGVVRDLELGLRSRSGSIFWGLLSARRLDLDGQPSLLVWLYDISQRKEMERELREFATIDHLTSLANRRHFLDLAAQEFERSRRYGHSLTVVMADLDHFKQINDTYGHHVGDQVIRAFAQELRAGLRTCDLVGRLGGEEFAAILPETSGPDAGVIAERIRASVAALGLGEAGEVHFTASFGHAGLDPADSTIASVLRRADAALYQAKKAGRNQVAWGGPEV
jgi:diguanylate cyclase (GGDEF)-like protein/PAS domain S-box-containing protein